MTIKEIIDKVTEQKIKELDVMNIDSEDPTSCARVGTEVHTILRSQSGGDAKKFTMNDMTSENWGLYDRYMANLLLALKRFEIAVRDIEEQLIERKEDKKELYDFMIAFKYEFVAKAREWLSLELKKKTKEFFEGRK